MESATHPGWKTSEFWTVILSQIIGVLLATGVITQNVASAAQNSTSLIGGILICAISGVLYIVSRLFLKLHLGPLPQFQDTTRTASPGPASPGPASTGPDNPLPDSIKGAV